MTGTEPADLLDLLDALEHPHGVPSPAVDVQRGYRPRHERCPDCDTLAFAMPWAGRTRTYKVVGSGWLTVSSCECGRYLWRSMFCGWLPEDEQPIIELPPGVPSSVDVDVSPGEDQ